DAPAQMLRQAVAQWDIRRIPRGTALQGSYL
ncbi:MAG: tRNA glutamyl-Q(34) synthetase GluQRS, partial [Acinetobacter sp.]|nr:tRNA glutamyl-Q(34) synthetase GluQRS [Acinetobacter sp.]